MFTYYRNIKSEVELMNLSKYIAEEISIADDLSADGRSGESFRHLERAHVLGQADTFWHTLVHWRMLKHGWRNRDVLEIWGQFIRIIGALTKTPFGIFPKGNTGGANVYFFKTMPIPDDLQAILDNPDSK